MAELITKIILLRKFMEALSNWNDANDYSAVSGHTTVYVLLQNIDHNINRMSNEEILKKTNELCMILETMIQLSDSNDHALMYVANQLDSAYSLAYGVVNY